jgi:D-sedoheptulose 7-phosphate isomerase
MSDDQVKLVQAIFRECANLHEQAAAHSSAIVVAVADAMQASFAKGGQMLIFGNGGSAADAQHFACELVGRFLRERRPVPAIALTTDTSILTAIANDYGYDRVFARQIEALGRPGDIALGITTSGASPNVLAGLQAAKSRGMTTIAFTGRDGGPVGATVDLHVNVRHSTSPRIQEVQRTIIHAVCELVERGL